MSRPSLPIIMTKDMTDAEKFSVDIRTRLRDIRLSRCRTLADVAEKTGVWAPTIGDWERKMNTMNLVHLHEYATALGLEVEITFRPMAGEGEN
ncbi:MAG: helix-turn-helix domain-containing protein [Candidatus Nanopelagicales bacterium]